MQVSTVDGKQQHITVLSREQSRQLHAASLEILERTGMFVESEAAVEILRAAGARVSRTTVRFPPGLVDGALKSVPHSVKLANRDGTESIFLEGTRSYFRGSSDNGRILDPYTRSRRPFVSSDYRLTARVLDACPHIHAGGCAGNARDFPAEIRPQVGFRRTMEHMRKPFVAAPLDALQMNDIYEMASIIAGSRERLRQAPFVVTTCEPTTPLGMHKDAAEILLQAASENMPVVWYGMPSAGTTAPATAAGVLAIGNAEILAGLVLHQLRQPGASFIYGMMPGMTDMRSAQWAYGSPDFALMLAAASDMAHGYGIPFYGTAGCSDAVDLDIQAAAEATMLCMMGTLSGANFIHDVGLMAGNQFVSPEMMVLTNELVDMVDHATRPIDTCREAMCLDLVDQVGPQNHFLDLDHTLANFRQFWHSNIFLRLRLSDSPADDEHPVRERINEKTRSIIETHTVEPLPCEVTRELDNLEKSWFRRA